MIQSGIHFGPILRQNQFELQNSDGSAGFGSLFLFYTQPGNVESQSIAILYF